MRKVLIPKGQGRFRTIYCPNKKEKASLSQLVPVLSAMERRAAHKHGVSRVAHGFVTGRNPVTCAAAHIGYSTTISCDLSSWFDSVTRQQLIDAGVTQDTADAITVDGACRQGLPTSPVAANLVAVQFDRMLSEKLKVRLISGYAYTRYADDVTVSWNVSNEAAGVLDDISQVALAMGWKVAEHKTHIQHSKAGKRVIVGIAVDDTIGMTRKTRRRLRAAKHQGNTKQIAGLTEWAACKLPRVMREGGLGRRIAGVDVAGIPAAVAPVVEQGAVIVAGTRRITLE